MEDPALNAHRIARGLTVLLLPLSACGGDDPGPEVAGADRPAELLVVDTLTVVDPLELPAYLYVERDAVIASRSGGVIDSLHADIGDAVEPGALLATIESVDQALEVDRAGAALEQAERTVARLRTLRERDGATAAELEAAELELREAAVALRQAQRALDLTRITAPFAGRVTARYVRPRWLVAPGDTLFRVAEPGPLLARVRVPEPAATAVRLGAGLEVMLAGGRRARGTVTTLAPAIDPGSGTREVILRLGPAPGAVPGASVTIRLGQGSRQLLAVPREAISADGQVLVQTGDRATLRAVVLGADLGDGRVEVVSGLRQGDRLVRPDR